MSGKRAGDPEEFQPEAVRNGVERKIYLLGKAVREIGVPTLMLGVFVGWFSGWIPSPLTAMAHDLRTHVADVNDTTKVLKILAGEIREQNRILRFKECVGLTNPHERRLCFGEAER